VLLKEAGRSIETGVDIPSRTPSGVRDQTPAPSGVDQPAVGVAVRYGTSHGAAGLLGDASPSARAPLARDRSARLLDGAALVMVGILAALITLSGVHTGWKTVDADELVYRRTLEAMRHGVDFYHAQRAALILKEHRPPTSIRAIRPPTLYLVLRWFPEASWRWLVGLVYLADLGLVWKLARRYGALAAAVAAALAAIWLFGDTTYLFLHAEVWGLPFFLAGALALRSRRVWLAALLLLAAACIRELYVAGLFVGLAIDLGPVWRDVVRARRRALERIAPWCTALLCGTVLYVVHSAFAATVLSAHGYNARFGNEHRTLAFLLRLVSPIVTGGGEAFGIAVTILGILGVIRVGRKDPAAIVCGASGVFLLAASVWATRVYWSACWALPIAAFAPAALGLGEAVDAQVEGVDRASGFSTPGRSQG